MRILVIPDGNRRAARKLNLSYNEIYSLAADKVDMAVKYLLSKEQIDALVFFGLSYDNIAKRTVDEMDPVYSAQENRYIKWLEEPFFSKYKIRVKFVGEFKRLKRSTLLPGGVPDSYIKTAQKLEEATMMNDWKYLYGLIGYSSKLELSRSFRKMHRATGDHESSDGLKTHYDVLPFMDVPFVIDLVIRTGKEQRMSDCLLYQTAYSEFIFLKKYFPEIDEKDLERCLQEYESRERRYGR